MRDTRSFNYSINGFRGLCVLLVFIYHVVNSGLIPKPPYGSAWASAAFFFASSFRYGVELFFMISGYVIVESLRRHSSVGLFLWDRCARIFPVWVPVHIILFLTGWLLGLRSFSHANNTDLLTVFWTNLLLIPPLASVPQTHDGSWSLTYEWLFYLIAAGAALFAQVRNTTLRYAGWSLLGGVAVALLSLMPRGLFFIPGVLLGLGAISAPKMRSLLRFPWLGLLVFLLAWRGVGLDEARPAAYSPMSLMMGWPALFTLIALVAGLYVFACVCLDSNRTAILRGSVMQQLGNISYSFYLWHPVMMFAVKRFTQALILPYAGVVWSTVFFAATSFVLALTVSFISYRLFEVRIGKALRRWFKQPAQSSTPAAVITVGVVRAEGG